MEEWLKIQIEKSLTMFKMLKKRKKGAQSKNQFKKKYQMQ